MLLAQPHETMLQTSSRALSVLTHFRPEVTTKSDTKNQAGRLGAVHHQAQAQFHRRMEQPAEEQGWGRNLTKAHTQKGHHLVACCQRFLLADCLVEKTNLSKVSVDWFVSDF